VFSTLGPGYRFRTPVCGTGPVIGGVLHGDLVLVASGDLLLSHRVQPDGTLALPIPDHSYDMPDTVPVPGDPLRPLRDLARQVAARGITRVSGHVLIDTSLFAQARTSIGVSAAGLVTISPIMINDNIVDVTVTPGNQAGAPGVVHLSPQTGYVQIVSQVTTVPASDTAPAPLSFASDVTNPDGTHTVVLTGDILVSTRHLYRAYYVPEPARFAAMAFAQTLRDAGIKAQAGITGMAPPYVPRGLLAEHVSPPVSEQVKVMLKTSSNVHTAMWEYVDGAIAGHDSANPAAAYGELMTRLFQEAGLDPSPPGYTPAFFVIYLAYIARQPYFPLYRDALPIMGKDGDLASVQADSPAAGHVYAKTGTGLGGTASHPVIDKALAGYIQSPDGGWIAFAEFMDMGISSPAALMPVADAVGEAMGAIAAAVYQVL
jgi:D-alanyl-D-alanine carboxypeptidase/D-alanyl-D-alanine-endopeptidase (penicillin-binding protein 4)